MDKHSLFFFPFFSEPLNERRYSSALTQVLVDTTEKKMWQCTTARVGNITPTVHLWHPNVSFCTSIPNFQAAGTFANLNSVFSTYSASVPTTNFSSSRWDTNTNRIFRLKKTHYALELCKETERSKIDSTPILLLYCLLPLLRAV